MKPKSFREAPPKQCCRNCKYAKLVWGTETNARCEKHEFVIVENSIVAELKLEETICKDFVYNLK